METREKTEFKVFVLNLADMRGGVDRSKPVAVFDDLEKLKSYYNSQLADQPYTDTSSNDDYGNQRNWHRVFKKSSLLEWFNPLSPVNNSGGIFEVVSYYDAIFGGVTEHWVDNLGFNIPFNPAD
jgi:hypothetical protein